MLMEGIGVRKRSSDGLPELTHLPGSNPEGRRIASLVDEPRLQRILAIMLDEDEFLGPHGIRAIAPASDSRRACSIGWTGAHVHYLPAESNAGMFGGNSNGRGPVVSDESDHPALTIATAPMKAAGPPGGAWWSSRVETASLSLLIARRDRGRGSRERREARERVGRAMRPTRAVAVTTSKRDRWMRQGVSCRLKYGASPLIPILTSPDGPGSPPSGPGSPGGELESQSGRWRSRSVDCCPV